MRKIDQILNQLEGRGFLNTTQRIFYSQADTSDVLRLVTKIGQERSPLFTIDSENIHAYTNAIKWLLADPTMERIDFKTGERRPGNLNAGLLIGGTTGTGKSWLLELLKATAILLKPEIKLYNRTTARIQLKTLFWKEFRSDEIVSDFQEGGKLKPFRNYGIVCIQDIGSEPLEALHMGNRDNVLKTILEYRADHPELITIGSTNLDLQGFGEHYGERVQSRVLQMFNYLQITGSDRREW